MMKKKSNAHGEKTLQALFPMSLLDPQRLVTATNLDTIYEYYLMENLASGLVRDDNSLPGGFAPVLAESYSQKNDKTWVFKIRSTTHWSDGSAVSGEDWRRSFMTLAQSSSRHMVTVKRLKDVIYDEKLQLLTMEFSEQTGDGLLHELSLADAVLLHPDNLKGDYTVTSGPYRVKARDLEKKTLDLVANPNHPLLLKKSPVNVHLFGLEKLEDLIGIFEKFEADIFLRPTPSSRDIYRAAEKNAPQVFRGHATSITYFGFQSDHPLGGDALTRKTFAEVVQAVFGKIGSSGLFKNEDQMVPEGYAGRINKLPTKIVSTEKFSPVRLLKLNLHPVFKEWPNLTADLDSMAEARGLKFEYEWSAMTGAKIPDGCFASITVFKGNQKDPLGSWSFLFSDKGTLSQFNQFVASEIEAAAAETNPDNRRQLLQAIHSRVLENHWAVPLLVDGNAMLASKRIDLSLISPFDMRLRYYLMTWAE